MHNLIKSFLHDVGCPLCAENVGLFVFAFVPDIKEWLLEKDFSIYAVKRALVWRERAAPRTHEEFTRMSEAFLESWNCLNAKDKTILQKNYELRDLRVTFWMEEPYVVLLGYTAHNLENFVEYVCLETGYSCPDGRAELISALREMLSL